MNFSQNERQVRCLRWAERHQSYSFCIGWMTSLVSSKIFVMNSVIYVSVVGPISIHLTDLTYWKQKKKKFLRQPYYVP